ncbi:glycosyltransferase family 2 protein [Phocaeicola sp.]
MDVSVIIVNYNTYSLTQNCIDSIYLHTKGLSFEVIVVDNASSDESVEMLGKDNRIKLIKSEENLGFGRANNWGYAHSTGKYLFLLNSDTIIMNNALKLFYDKMEQLPDNIACLGTLLFTDETCTRHGHSYAEFAGGFQLLYQLFLSRTLSKFGMKFGKCLSDGQSNSETFFRVPQLIGADMFMRRDVAEKYGLFDSDFFMYYEETEMQFRYTQKGYLIFIYREPRIVHLEGKSSDKVVLKKSAWKLMQLTRSQVLYVKKVFKSKWYIGAYKLTLFFIMASFLVIHPWYDWKTRKVCFRHLMKIIKI